jgi:hypothetical protein
MKIKEATPRNIGIASSIKGEILRISVASQTSRFDNLCENFKLWGLF